MEKLIVMICIMEKDFTSIMVKASMREISKMARNTDMVLGRMKMEAGMKVIFFRMIEVEMGRSFSSMEIVTPGSLSMIEGMELENISLKKVNTTKASLKKIFFMEKENWLKKMDLILLESGIVTTSTGRGQCMTVTVFRNKLGNMEN